MQCARFFTLICCILLTAALLTSPLQAQSVGSLFNSGGTETSEASDQISEIMKQAAENGVGVVVIDSDGQVLTTPNATVEPETDTAEGSNLMQAQDALVGFRSALIERVLDLPNAFNEVIYILRATSPDGTIWAFFYALFVSLALFSVGVIFEKQVYGKRIVRNFVVSRIRDKPEGYAEKMPFLVFRFFMGVIGILVSMIVAYVLGAIIFGPLEDKAMQFTVSVINTGYFMCRLVANLWRMVLSPFLDQYRIPVMATRDAKRLYR